MEKLNLFIANNDNFYLFGADGEGAFCHRWLKEKNKTVQAYVDNDIKKIGGILEELAVLSIQDVDLFNAKIIITSIHADEIAIQLTNLGLQLGKDYIAYDNLYWIDEPQFYNCVGLPFYEYFKQNKSYFGEVLGFLSDDYSKEIYTRVINYRLTSLNPIRRGKNNLPISFEQHRENTNLQKNKQNIKLNEKYTEQVEKILINNLWRETYEYKSLISNENLDVIFDIGGFIGDTASVFAYKNKRAKVYVFEPSIEGFNQISIMKNEFHNIIPVQKGVWDTNTLVEFKEEADNLISARIGEGNRKIECITLDTFVEQNKLNKIDFIKMDIEGAELKALEGAKEAIRQYKPDLAICIYHSPTDLWKIPLWIKNNFPEYDIYVDHTDGLFVWGTVCFATNKRI